MAPAEVVGEGVSPAEQQVVELAEPSGAGRLPAWRRKRRVQYPGAIHHVINRSDRREPIFREDADRLRFLVTLGEAYGKAGWQVHA